MKLNNMWQNLNKRNRLTVLAKVKASGRYDIPLSVIEKDWWVCAVIKAAFDTSCRESLLFKGGTSLSKAWQLIDRFSEDVDLAIHHSFFGIEKTNKSQKDKLRKTGRRYVHEVLSAELNERLKAMGIKGYHIENVTTVMRSDGAKPIDSDKDPTVILVHYDSILDETDSYSKNVVKIETSCLSMDEPNEPRTIRSMVSELFPDVDSETDSVVRTVVPTRTFLEKAFLLNEEFQKDNPRHKRMSRHLYDIERLMNTPFGEEAINDRDLYNRIVEHRKTYYAVKNVDYSLHAPSSIRVCPPDSELDKWEDDYVTMRQSFIYGDSIPFDELIARIRELEHRFRGLE